MDCAKIAALPPPWVSKVPVFVSVMLPPAPPSAPEPPTETAPPNAMPALAETSKPPLPPPPPMDCAISALAAEPEVVIAPSLLRVTVLAPPPTPPEPPIPRAKLAKPPPEMPILAPPLPPPPPMDCATIPYERAPVVVIEPAFTAPLLIFSAVTDPPEPPEPPEPPMLKVAA